jgi:ligand-binding sensor domain-containing protein
MRDLKMYNPKHAKACYLANVKYIGTCDGLCYFDTWDGNTLALSARDVSAEAIEERLFQYEKDMRRAEKSRIREMIQ